LAQQLEMLQQQQQQIAAAHQQYVNVGMLQPQQQMQNFGMQGMQNASPHGNNYQFPQQMQQQHLGIPLNPPTQPSAHRRNQSAAGMGSMGPPPAPSAGLYHNPYTCGHDAYYYDDEGRENAAPRGRGGPVGGGHARRHSLALPEAKKAAELAEQKRRTSNFQFPGPGNADPSNAQGSTPPSPTTAPVNTPQHNNNLGVPRGRGGHGRSQSMATGNIRGGNGFARGGGGGFQFPPSQATENLGAPPGSSDFARRGSHGRSGSRNFDGNWRQPQNNPPQDQQQSPMGSFSLNNSANATPFQPSHRNRGSATQQSIGSLGNFQYGGQPQQLLQLPQGQVLLPQMFGTQSLNPLQFAQLQALQQMNGQSMNMQGGQHAPQMGMHQNNQQQRKTLFTPYLPQATLPALLGDGQLVAGILRVNKKNRSDAYVTTNDLDADIFICGSKDRNRALEGDFVAIELLDVDEVWGQKREKEEKKKRKDGHGGQNSTIAVNDATTQPENSAETGGIRRRGSLRQRPTQKKNDDVEVEGQSLLLMEEEEINDEQKPLYAGHVVAVIERIAGQMFSG
jgi:protein SSD1